MVKRRNLFVAVIAVVCMLMSLFAVLTGGGLTAYAESPVSSSDGTYSVPVNLDGLAMGADNFSSAATVEKSGKNYYMTFGHSSSVDDLVLESGNMQRLHRADGERLDVLHLYHVRGTLAGQPFLHGIYRTYEHDGGFFHHYEFVCRNAHGRLC